MTKQRESGGWDRRYFSMKGQRRWCWVLFICLSMMFCATLWGTSIPIVLAQPSSPEAKADIMVGGRVLFEVGSIESFSASQRADIANTQIDRILRSTPPDVPIQLDVETQGDLTTIWMDNRLLLTITVGDMAKGVSPVAQAEQWVAILERSLAQAQFERTPIYQRQTAITSAVLLVTVLFLHGIVRWLSRRIRQQSAQQAAQLSADLTGWSSHWFVRSLLQPVLFYSRLGLGIATVFYLTGLFSWSRSWRYRLVEFLQATFTAPVFALGDQDYSLFDFGQAAVLVVGLWIGVRVVTALVRSRLLREVGASRDVQDAIALSLQVILIGLGLIIILSGLGFDLSSLAIFASVLGVGVGFGLQNIANNFMSGLIILFERPIRVGDFVKLGDLTGTVERIGARSTEIRTLDLVTIIVPNSELIESKVINWSHGHPVSRLHVPFGVAYGSPIRQMRSVVMEAVQVHPEILRYPQPQVRFLGLGDSSLDFEALVWIRDPRQQFRLKSDLYYLLDANFRRHNIDIPFPQRDVRIHWPDQPAALTALLDSPSSSAPSTLESSFDRGSDPQSRPSTADLLTELMECSLLVRQKGDVSDDEMHQLVAEMRGGNGVDIGDRRYGLQVYKRCFVGTDAVAWLAQHQKATREEALRIGQLLIERGHMHHVTDEHAFEDKYLFYRFYLDEVQI
ncbi:MAG: mechanosensitive ion channel domain-containing protein [Leptolyngbyaceae cyanobacterium]